MNDETKVSPPVPETKAAADQGFTTLNISGESSAYRWGDAEAYRKQMQSGARWFFWIAGLSLINSIAAVTIVTGVSWRGSALLSSSPVSHWVCQKTLAAQ